ncbi:MAG: hypothetical protein FWD66_02575, partial [Paludibacter sp.]|nr:hypothetical protein [Paludibacter sp.]
FVELPKFKPKNFAEKKLRDLWLRFLTEINESTTEVPKELLENELTREAVQYTEKAAYSKAQLESYDKWKIAAMTERSALKDAKNEGLAEGLLEGEAIGEHKKAVIIAKNLLAKGMSKNEVCEATGLNEIEINQILKQ